MFFRVKPAGSDRYLQIAHSVREGQKVRQQVIATLGRLDLLEASGQLERLMRSGLRHCEKFAVIDAHAAGEIQPVAANAATLRVAGNNCGGRSRDGEPSDAGCL